MPSRRPGGPGPEGDRVDWLPDPDPVPPGVVADAKAAFDTETGHELAMLASDSLVEDDASSPTYVLRFSHSRMSVQLRIHAEGSTTIVDGSIEPSGPSTALLHIAGTNLAVAASVEEGAFRFSPTGHGSVRISLEGEPDGSVIWTDWFRI